MPGTPLRPFCTTDIERFSQNFLNTQEVVKVTTQQDVETVCYSPFIQQCAPYSVLRNMQLLEL